MNLIRLSRLTSTLRLDGLRAASLLSLALSPCLAQAVDNTGHWFGGGGPAEGVVLTGSWTFDQYTPEQIEEHVACSHGISGPHGGILDWQGWTPSPESNVLPRVEQMDADWIDPTQFPDSTEFRNVGGGVLAFYADVGGQPGFLPFQLSLMESPVVEAVELGIPGDPLTLVFSSLSNPDPALAALQWVAGVRYYDGVSWTPWFDQYAPLVPGQIDNQFHLAPVPIWATVQFRIGIRNPNEDVLINKKGAGADKAKAGTKPPTVTDETWKYVPDIKQDGGTCAGASVADCLAYWAKSGYPEIMPAGTDTTKRHNKLRDDLIKKIYGNDKAVGGDGADQDNWGGGISDYLKEKGVGEGQPQPAGRDPLVHRRVENPPCDTLKHEFGQCHDVMVYFKWCKEDGTPVKKDDGSEPAHQVTMGGIVKTSDGKTVVHAAHGWGDQTDEVNSGNRDKAYDKFEFECVNGKIQLKNEELLKKYKSKGAHHLCVTEINVVKPEAPPPLPQLLAEVSVSPPDKGGRSRDSYGYAIVNDESTPMNYFAMILDVPFQDVQAPPGWTWQPLPAPFPSATDCDQWLTADGILWKTTGAPVQPGGTLGGFGFSVDSIYPPGDLGGQWYTQTTAGNGAFGFVAGPVLPAGMAAPDFSEPSTGGILQVFPNPARGAVTVRFALPAPGEYRVELFDAAGRRVRTYAGRADRAGLRDWTWDGLDDAGRGVSAGAYFCRMSAGGVRSEERVIVVE